ncbi:methionyl-tRNA formyltransferase [Polaribacter aestuariivivens]|uniref:Methionyl-tRNA formyltransferase n=1 Tax=Polaribacter aestuariivivens TaxID=2304626 RepID=A0A5S3N1L6_9FLAO|nr:methionyl-tRNA formyltransferase [Polaribacter aestuariivivens]TMM29155.1 methionyl-tRNA formyltransferase [Polaribacter aestuariivivens]
MNNYLILSHKPWNISLADKMKAHFSNDNWFFIDNKNDFNSEKLQQINPDYIFIPHWSYIIKEEIYENYNCIVFHMTDLPFGRGGSPLQNLIAKKIKETKISAIKVVKKIDGGPIYLKEKLNLFGTAEEIFLRANDVICNMIVKIINQNMTPVAQTGEPVIFKRRTPEMSKINKEIKDVNTLYDHIRMLDADGYPKAYIETDFFKFEFTRASLKSNETIISDVRIVKK